MFLSVIIPCYEEAACIARFEAELLPALDALDLEHEVLAVDDGSRDATAHALRGLAARHTAFKALAHGRNRGLGAALRTGFAAASGEWVATLDADLSFHPAQIRGLLEAQARTGADLVAGSPFLHAESAAGVAWPRRLPSLLLNAFYRGLCGRELTAYTPIFRLYRASVLRGLRLRSEGFEINTEIAAAFLADGRSVTEVPAILTARRYGRSKLSPLRELWRHACLAGRMLRAPARD